MFDLVVDVETKITKRIKTRALNDFFLNVIRQAPAPVWGNDNVKFYYLTQTNQQPPAFIAFANHPDGVTNAYRRFLAKRIQEEWDLKGIPIRIFVMTGAHRQKKRGRKAPEPVIPEHLLADDPDDFASDEEVYSDLAADMAELPPEAGLIFGVDDSASEQSAVRE